MYKGSGGTIDFKSQIAHVDICTYCLPVFFCVSPVSEGVITGCYLAAQYPITPSSLAPPSVGETTYPITLHSPSTSGRPRHSSHRWLQTRGRLLQCTGQKGQGQGVFQNLHPSGMWGTRGALEAGLLQSLLGVSVAQSSSAGRVTRCEPGLI